MNAEPYLQSTCKNQCLPKRNFLSQPQWVKTDHCPNKIEKASPGLVNMKQRHTNILKVVCLLEQDSMSGNLLYEWNSYNLNLPSNCF
ncbi:UNVERIFIED_CONTAM: hypothetical protein NCL1_51356 [Trichonephila clavipes]